MFRLEEYEADRSPLTAGEMSGAQPGADSLWVQRVDADGGRVGDPFLVSRRLYELHLRTWPEARASLRTLFP
ncbi:MAG: hypothetical protein K2K93_04150 [Muribaculaceae bacterium]|nr:hypothetical protein [Muribaculaceae bacterium]